MLDGETLPPFALNVSVYFPFSHIANAVLFPSIFTGLSNSIVTPDEYWVPLAELSAHLENVYPLFVNSLVFNTNVGLLIFAPWFVLLFPYPLL